MIIPQAGRSHEHRAIVRVTPTRMRTLAKQRAEERGERAAQSGSAIPALIFCIFFPRLMR